MRVDHAKMGAPDRPAAGDVFLNRRFRRALPSTLARLHRAEVYFGHGFFNIVEFGQLFKEAANIPKIGGFGIDEIGLLQWLFFKMRQVLGLEASGSPPTSWGDLGLPRCIMKSVLVNIYSRIGLSLYGTGCEAILVRT